jgi:hypothetical protein
VALTKFDTRTVVVQCRSNSTFQYWNVGYYDAPCRVMTTNEGTTSIEQYLQTSYFLSSNHMCFSVCYIFNFCSTGLCVQKHNLWTRQLDSFFYPNNQHIISSGLLSPNNNIYRNEQNRIDSESKLIRCSRYGLRPFNGTPRRLFFGSMIADENWEVFQIHATEVFHRL